jgi:hypothetical protein
MQAPRLFPILAAFALAASAVAQPTPQIQHHLPTTTVINACVNKFDGLTRIVNSKSECNSFEKFDSWNIQGPTGPQGPIGLPGVAGPKGATGATGLAGPAGAKGATGTAGPAGATGATGPAGPAGIQGTAGPAGPAGIAGAKGATGPAGPAGVAGAIGAAGPAGAQGLTGLTGPVGPAGPQGAQGPAGADGTGSIPANLTAVSSLLGTSGYTGADFEEPATCTLGDIILSVNAYGSNALPADGRLMPINQNTALFSLLGTTFGGNGTQNFALPDLRAIAPKGLQYSICAQGFFPPRN